MWSEPLPVELDYASPAAGSGTRRVWVWLVCAALFALCEVLLLTPAIYFALDPVYVDTHGGATPRADPLVLFLLDVDEPAGRNVPLAVMVLGYGAGLAGAWLAARGGRRARMLLIACTAVMAILAACAIAQDWLLARASPINYYDRTTGQLVGQSIYGFGSTDVLAALLVFFPAWLLPLLLWWFPPVRRRLR